MSCHDIGRGLNSVVKVVMKLYDLNKISFEAAKKIIIACKNGVGWCDGNEYEAIDYIVNCRCGRCLKMVPKGQKLYDIINTSSEIDGWDIIKKMDLISYCLCDECFDQVFAEYFGDPSIAQSEKNHIETREVARLYDYESEGEYPDGNNEIPWPK